MSFDPFAATLDEAMAHADPLAIARWGGAQQLIARREFYEQHPLDGIAICCRSDLTAPEWLARAYLRGFDKVLRCEVASWDSAFGVPVPKGTNLARARARRRMRVAIWNDVLATVQSCPNRPLNEVIEAVGRKHGAGRTLADDLYREAIKMMGFGAAKLRRAAAGRSVGTTADLPARTRKLAGIQHKR
jgi:hypothetical protein